jgi:hypothetical protein
MSFSYDASRKSDLDRIRLMMADTIEATAVFSDEDIALAQDMQSNIFLATALLAYNRAAALASKAVQYMVAAGVRASLSVDRRATPKFWTDLAKKMEDLSISMDVAEAFDRFAFDIGPDGRDYSDYQGWNRW